MKTAILFVALLAAAVGGCASERKIPSREAVDDFVVVSELPPADSIRYFGQKQLQQTYVNDYYIILSTRKDDYLIEFTKRCWALTDNSRVEADIRHESNVLRAKFDTIRGCRIKAMYPINKGQAEELKSLGDAPGETLK